MVGYKTTYYEITCSIVHLHLTRVEGFALEMKAIYMYIIRISPISMVMSEGGKNSGFISGWRKLQYKLQINIRTEIMVQVKMFTNVSTFNSFLKQSKKKKL